MKQVEFYFDLGSPYSYVAFYQIQNIANNNQAEIIWKPILLGGVFKATGNSSPMVVPAKARYSMLDITRWCKYLKIPMQMNPHFPINTLTLMRIVAAVQIYQPEQFMHVLTGLFNAMFREPKNLNDAEVLQQTMHQLGFEAEQIQTWLADENVKNHLKQLTEEAIERGVFGAPTCFVDDEIFWGLDHLNFVEMALKSKT
ncbi:2-hydroxychromene-2-carboxylate isomerase [Acinetobacter gerneri]|uniref:2-hydroxychromene-2-carboxylate isomerase n=1 Tax=Acinetobacter gerneri TaxID=202952 RepID=UPI002936CCFB|nr:2-hydroxychromene-2-carboxylate isomerase [Acinetobacter gerneri]MDV2441780.1 2-hydroxychromene-2-carboxylate isomerase [Acinetobacter gerneri]